MHLTALGQAEIIPNKRPNIRKKAVAFDQRPRPIHNRYTRTGTCFRWGMTVTYNRYKFIWLGWPYLRTKEQGPWHKGACFNFLPSFGGAFYTKSARRPRQVPGQFPDRLEVSHKNVSDWFYK
jgi:hypothetical protein